MPESGICCYLYIPVLVRQFSCPVTESKGRCAPGTNACPFSASARHVYDYLAANASTVQYEYCTSNRRAPYLYEYCSRILLRTDKARGDVVYVSYDFVIFSVLFRHVFV